MRTVDCEYCQQPAVLMTNSGDLYHGHDYGPVWHCKPCKAWVGVHKDSKDFAPLGRLANGELRGAKMAAHFVFDPLWERKMARDGCSKTKARHAAYSWLAGQMGMTIKDCHIGMFDVQQCLEAVRICRAVGAGKKNQPA
ncbi:zinc-finger-containing protein [Nevskia ramosa]|uniref:zinc-finger-containing protein n=1 Tax=Nevskia ramosa TaxID=64002 RepID=UPI003D1389F8